MNLQTKSLHDLCMTIGEIKQQIVEELPHYGHHSLFFQNNDITTGILDNKNEIKINLLTCQLLCFEDEHALFIDLKNDDILKKLKSIFDCKGLKISAKHLNNISAEESVKYCDFAKNASQLLELFRMSLRGNFTMVHLWPHHFDFSLEWFTGIRDEQISIGISPGDEQYSEPYLYMNPWPFEEKITLEPLPIGKWHTDGWNGVKVRWDELVKTTPENTAHKITELFGTVKKSF